MEQRAAHIHEVIERGGTVQHLQSDVQDLDRLVHQVEGLVESLGRFREIDRRAYAQLAPVVGAGRWHRSTTWRTTCPVPTAATTTRSNRSIV